MTTPARVVIVLLFLISAAAHGAQSQYLHQPVLSARIMGMGGAFVAVADDYYALYYNVAGLSRLESGQLNAGIQVGGTPSILTFYSDMQNAGSDVNKMANALAQHFGDHYESRVGLGATWVRPGWGIGFQPLDLTLQADIHSTAGGSVGVQAYQDSTIQFGKAYVMNEQKTFSIGVAPKAIYRGYFEKDLFAIDLASNSGQLVSPKDAQEGLAFDFDVGALYSLDIPSEGWFSWFKLAKPTFGFAVRNVLNYGFTDLHLFSPQSSNITSAAGYLDRRFDVGTKFDLPEFWVFKPRIAVDGRDLGARYASFNKCFHAGAELLWKAFSWLNGGYRIGVSEGDLTLGLSAEFGVFNLDLAMYSDDVGTSDSPRLSRNFIAKMSLDF